MDGQTGSTLFCEHRVNKWQDKSTQYDLQQEATVCEISGSQGGECEDERVFWDIASCSLRVERRCRGAYCLPSSGWSSPPWSRRQSPWWWRKYARLKRRSTPTRLHGALSRRDLLVFKPLFVYISVYIVVYSFQFHVCLRTILFSNKIGVSGSTDLLRFNWQRCFNCWKLWRGT
jgi:hypothetical protein